MKFHKYHGLGNDYIVIDPQEATLPLREEIIRLICDRNYGVGSDGILYGPIGEHDEHFSLRIFNPDGSEAEKSGNGLRIFSRYLWDRGLVEDMPFSIFTKGGLVAAQVLDEGNSVRVEMGKVSFAADAIPVIGVTGDVLNQQIHIGDRTFKYCAATIGNPHCVILDEAASPETAKAFGPAIENHALFPNRTNVQFLQVLDRDRIKIEIWERGAGYTLASGSSSTAAAAVAHRLGFCGNNIEVNMPGGTLNISFLEDFSATMTGPVVAICDGEIRGDFFEKSRNR
ncbi:MAG: diaminopimelate epimerase [Deltaproteobacteria bacterium]|nr:diaminopimelate epimerase [Deltaproteobacteria bacterium]